MSVVDNGDGVSCGLRRVTVEGGELRWAQALPYLTLPYLTATMQLVAVLVALGFLVASGEIELFGSVRRHRLSSPSEPSRLLEGAFARLLVWVTAKAAEC
jgi:hypothetical protein